MTPGKQLKPECPGKDLLPVTAGEGDPCSPPDTDGSYTNPDRGPPTSTFGTAVLTFGIFMRFFFAIPGSPPPLPRGLSIKCN
jgi:hypothetical protein